jgi:hypothetical protein
MRCDELHELAPEVALGIVEGEERAEALRHLATCADCRRRVEQLSGVTDELLLLAPVQEPPMGFESRVAEAMRPPPRRHRARQVLRVLVPAVAAAAVTAGALVGVYHDDRVTADRYRETLEQAGGQAFMAAPLEDETGARAGVAFGYQGRPSWMLVTVAPEHRDRIDGATLVTTDRRTIPLPGFRLDANGSWGGAIPVRLYEVAAIRLHGDQPGEALVATLPRD